MEFGKGGAVVFVLTALLTGLIQLSPYYGTEHGIGSPRHAFIILFIILFMTLYFMYRILRDDAGYFTD